MKFDVRSAIVGFLIALVIMFAWQRFRKMSYYDIPTFTDDMTLEQAQALQENTAKMMAEDLTKRQTAAGDDTAAVGAATKEVQDAMVKLAADFSAFQTRKSMAPAAPDAPAAPEAPAAPAAQTSTFKSESYY